MSHTKGPWSMRERYIEILDSTVTMDVFAVTANRAEDTVCEIPMDASNAEANARLIAAAPDLLEACRHMIMEWRLHGSLTDSARVGEAAIAKATKGEVTQ